MSTRIILALAVVAPGCVVVADSNPASSYPAPAPAPAPGPAPAPAGRQTIQLSGGALAHLQVKTPVYKKGFYDTIEIYNNLNREVWGYTVYVRFRHPGNKYESKEYGYKGTIASGQSASFKIPAVRAEFVEEARVTSAYTWSQ